MTRHFAAFALLACTWCAAVAHPEVSHLRYNRFGRLTTRLHRQQAPPTAYPAAGFRPQLAFDIPSNRGQQQFLENDLGEDDAAGPSLGANGDSIAPPDLLYGAPTRFRSFNPAPQQQRQRQRQRLLPQQTYTAPERTYGAPDEPLEEPQAERITAAAVRPRKSERLTDNREDREDEDDDDDDASDIEVDARASDKKPATVQPTTTTPNVVYYPAGAVGFVHPLAAYVQQTAAYYAQPMLASTLLNGAPAAAAAPKSATAASDAPAALAPAPARLTAAAAAPAAAHPLAVSQPQYFAAPFFQRLTYAMPAQLQAW